MVFQVGSAESRQVLTHAGCPNPHRLDETAQPTPAGLPVALGPLIDAAELRGAANEDFRKQALESKSLSDQGRHLLQGKPIFERKSCAMEMLGHKGPLLSDQVLRQKAMIAELAALDAQARAAEARRENEEDVNTQSYEGEEDEEASIERRMERLMASVQPCSLAYPAAVAQSTERQRIETPSGKWTPLKGLRLVVKTATPDDCVLLVASSMHTPESDKESACWTLQCAGKVISPKFTTHVRHRSASSSVCLPYLDQPNRKAELEYTLAANSPSCSRFVVSAERERRQLTAVTLPASQCAWIEDDDHFNIDPGPWVDVHAFYEVVTTLPGDKILAIATMEYVASWASELNRGRFTIVRDDTGLDGLHDRGLQSVRALSPNLRRVMVMAAVDEPPPGPHIYRVRGALTVGSESGVSATLQGDRQLTLIRLPGSLIRGPCLSSGAVTIDEPQWTEIPGMCTSVTLRRPRDRVLLVYHTDCHPAGFSYQAHFTILRHSEAGGTVNLGLSADFGLERVSSDHAASTEYPVGILCDTPGSLGPHTYAFAARVVNTGVSTDCPPVVVGYSGAISAIILPAR